MRATILVASVALLPSGARAAPQQSGPSLSPAGDVRQYVQMLARALSAPSASASQRSEAARRLVEVGTPAARQAITDGLRSDDR
ncbi:MAG TPA: hypothetical protein VN541_25090, partial [Tepidisphaeraceae bacterium]|nr:hypothetical protein [Tepidisphaeraceae bacterium]